MPMLTECAWCACTALQAPPTDTDSDSHCTAHRRRLRSLDTCRSPHVHEHAHNTSARTNRRAKRNARTDAHTHSRTHAHTHARSAATDMHTSIRAPSCTPCIFTGRRAGTASAAFDSCIHLGTRSRPQRVRSASAHNTRAVNSSPTFWHAWTMKSGRVRRTAAKSLVSSIRDSSQACAIVLR